MTTSINVLNSNTFFLWVVSTWKVPFGCASRGRPEDVQRTSRGKTAPEIGAESVTGIHASDGRPRLDIITIDNFTRGFLN